MQQFKNEFVKQVGNKIKRDGICNLMKWLENETDFFTAPASTRYHGAHEYGLVEHSLNVYRNLVNLVTNNWPENKQEMPDGETVAIVSLFHDICKANFYGVEMRNRKNENTGKWEKVPFYMINDQFPAGHGEKSVILLQKFITLTPQEIMAVNWHMGFSDIRASQFSGMNSVSNAMDKYPLVVMNHMADLMATFFDEERGK